MGVYRLILAYMVVFGHMYQPFLGFYGVGVSAVISFFLLSGFVMTALIKKYYFTISSIPAFYVERFLRLTPQFYFYSIITLIGAMFFGLRHDFMQAVPSIKSLILQFGLVPLDLYRYFPSMLLPQAWSLGLEVLFYAVFPFVMLYGLRFSLAVLSLCMYLAAYFGYIDNELWGYRYLPGTFFIFICGSFLHTAKERKETLFVYFVFIGTIVLLGLTYLYSHLASLYNRSVLIGLVLGIPAVWWLKPLSHESGKGNTIDGLAGNLSYGVFLSHMFVIGSLETFYNLKIGGLGIWQDAEVIVLVFITATALSYLSFNILEKPLVDLRRKGRQRHLDVNRKA